ncbi:MAG: hypothetical protein HY216_13670, partial [Candidatus Rokubacteria bacterium]|nr:hypothetical protein [Candidatus Rokubacteria bacterium]
MSRPALALARLALAAVLLGDVAPTCAQPANTVDGHGPSRSKVPRIGYLSTLTRAADATLSEAFRQGLRERGWVEGRNVTIESRFGEGNPGRVPALAAELAGLNVDVIVVGGGSRAVQAARQTTGTIPLVMTIADDPVA